MTVRGSLPKTCSTQSVWGKYARPTDVRHRSSVSCPAITRKWHPTEQIPERAIGTPRLRGRVLRARSDGDRRDHALDRHGALARRRAGAPRCTRSTTTGTCCRIRLTTSRSISSIAAGSAAGATSASSSSSDRLDAERRRRDALRRHRQRRPPAHRRRSLRREHRPQRVSEGSVGVLRGGDWNPIDRLRLLGGLRGDYYDFDVTREASGGFARARRTTAASRRSSALAYAGQPRRRAVRELGPRLSLERRARRRAIRRRSGPGLSPGTGKEVGARFEIGTLKLTATYWWLDLDSELKFVGDSNSVEPRGGDGTARLRARRVLGPARWLGIDACGPGSHARYVDSPDGRYIAGAVENAGELGISAVQEALGSEPARALSRRVPAHAR